MGLLGQVSRAAWGIGKAGARAGLLGAAGAVGAAAKTGLAAGYAGYRGLAALGGGHLLEAIPHHLGTIGGTSFGYRTFALNRGAQRALTVGALGIGVGLGGMDHYKAQRGGWSLNTSGPYPEIERPEMLGATGSLGLALAKRSGGPQPTFSAAGAARSAALASDDILMAILRRR